MQLKMKKLDIKRAQQLLREETKFIKDLLTLTSIPERKDFIENKEDNKFSGFNKTEKKKSRAKSLQELQQRLEAIKSKKKLSYKEKLAKKGLKNRMKKKNKQDERNAKHKLLQAAKAKQDCIVKSESVAVNNDSTEIKTETKVFNEQDKLVFSKIDFSNIGQQKHKKQDKDPKRLLKKLVEQKEITKKLEEQGDVKKAVEIKENMAWKNALAKAQGEKVKDDPTLLKKTVMKNEQRKRSHKKKWDERIDNVKKAKEGRQKKRQENIDKRKKEKKVKKMKTASKRGKIIPGF